jgi:hypothetical protein
MKDIIPPWIGQAVGAREVLTLVIIEELRTMIMPIISVEAAWEIILIPAIVLRLLRPKITILMILPTSLSVDGRAYRLWPHVVEAVEDMTHGAWTLGEEVILSTTLLPTIDLIKKHQSVLASMLLFLLSKLLKMLCQGVTEDQMIRPKLPKNFQALAYGFG